MRLIIPLFLLPVGISFLFVSLSALGNSLAEDRAINASQLSRHTTWRKLLHYEKHSQEKSGYLSAIHSPDFFLSPDGRSNSLSELHATLIALGRKLDGDPNDHAQCRFPARYAWLRKQSQEVAAITPIRCPNYDHWSQGGSTDSISIVFATGYLGNPASYYGHTLLKLNSNKADESTKLEDVSVNFGAIVPDGDGPIPYILKGLFGGYDAGFSHIQYYYHTHNYGENELRDMWEYELDLDQFQVRLVIGHAWEVLGKKYTYYFLNKNCVYRMAEVVEVVPGVNIISDKGLWSIPQSLLQELDRATLDSKPLVKAVRYHPSRQSRLYKRFESLNARERKAVRREVDNKAAFDSQEFLALTLASQQLVLDALMDYYQFLRDPEKLDADVNNIIYRKVLAKRFSLPPGGKSVDFTAKNPPHKGRKPSLIQIGLTHNEVLGRGLRLKLRPAYYDALDGGDGHVSHSMLSMAELEMTYGRGRARINRFNVVRIESINGGSTGLPGDRAKAWSLSLGAQEADQGCEDECLVAILTGGMGYTLPASSGWLMGGFAGAALQESKLDQGAVYASATVFADLDSIGGVKTRFSIEHRNYLLGSASTRTQYRIESHYQLNREWGVRGYMSESDTFEVGFSFAKYF